MTTCYLRAASVFGPGLALWQQARLVLRGEAAFTGDTPLPPAPALLAANERRRAGLPTRLALAVCEDATTMSAIPPQDLACVFTSANGEGAIVHALLDTLAGPDRQLSPTQFHNSVHNAVAGYWSIATQTTQPVTCLAAEDHSFAAGLLQAAAACTVTQAAILFCAYDAPIPQPLGAGRPTAFSFATAFVLTPKASPGALARLHVRLTPAQQDSLPRNAGLAALVPGNAAARSLRLLESLALGVEDAVCLALTDGGVEIEVSRQGLLF